MGNRDTQNENQQSGTSAQGKSQRQPGQQDQQLQRHPQSGENAAKQRQFNDQIDQGRQQQQGGGKGKSSQSGSGESEIDDLDLNQQGDEKLTGDERGGD